MIENIIYIIAGVISCHGLVYSFHHHEIFLGILNVISIVIFGIMFAIKNKNI